MSTVNGEPESVSPRTAGEFDAIRGLTPSGSPETKTNDEFQSAAHEPAPRFCKEFGSFLWHSPSWWLAPLIIMLMLLGLAVTLIPVETMPFIYTLW